MENWASSKHLEEPRIVAMAAFFLLAIFLLFQDPRELPPLAKLPVLGDAPHGRSAEPRPPSLEAPRTTAPEEPALAELSVRRGAWQQEPIEGPAPQAENPSPAAPAGSFAAPDSMEPPP